MNVIQDGIKIDRLFSEDVKSCVFTDCKCLCGVANNNG